MIEVLTSLYVQLLVVTTLGQAIHLLFKAQSLKYKARIANTTFSGRAFLKDDSFNIAITFAFMAIGLFLIEDYVKLYPKIENHLKGIFAIIGYAGSDLVLRIGGRTTKVINKVIDEKTNIADGVVTKKDG